MSPTIRRCTRALAAALVAFGVVVVLAAPPAGADPIVPFDQDVDASTHLAKTGMDITVPRGEFIGTIDVATGNETGNLTLPPANVTINLLGLIPMADASFVMAPAGPITGHVDLTTFEVDTTASFNVRLARLTPHGTDVNLVGDGCTTTEPITVRMQGVVNPTTGGTFASTYTIPDFENCQAMTPLITALVSGPGNTFVASFAPHGSPPPPDTSEPAPPAPPLASVDVHGSITVGGTPNGDTTVPLDVDQTVPGPSSSPPPLVTATPAPEPSTTTTAPPPASPPPSGGLGDLLGRLFG
jgi:hypothetical protein